MKMLYQKASVKHLRLLLLGLVSSVSATEFRLPLPIEHGPMRQLFGEEEDVHGVRFWASLYTRYADKAFTDTHGTDTEPLTALFFNKDDFRFTEAFPDSLIPLKSEFYNPLLRTTRLRLRTNYAEQGLAIGGSWDYPFYTNRGRIGLRAALPIKRVKVEKIDMEGVRDGAQLQDVMSEQPALIESPTTSMQAPSGMTGMVRLDFAEALVQSGDRNSAVKYGTAAYRSEIGAGMQVDGDAWPAVPYINPPKAAGFDGVNMNDENARNAIALTYSPEGFIPREPDTYIYKRYSSTATDATAFPTDASITAKKAYYFHRGDNYSLLADETQTGGTAINMTQRLKNQAAKANVWIMPIQRTSADHPVGGKQWSLPAVDNGGPLKVLKDLAEQVTENGYEWMHDRGFDFETFTKEGVGDLDVDLYYEHQFEDTFLGQIYAGVRLPTGGKREYTSNPYYTPLGNGGHYEVKIGGMLAAQAGSWIGIKGDAYYAIVLEENEERAATFKNSQIKNLGPQADAAVDWKYFVGRVDLNLQHPSTPDITVLLGYEFDYKQEESVRFVRASMASWLGRSYNTTTNAWDDNKQLLDSNAAAYHTKQYGHRVRWEASYILSDWFEFLWGGCWTFAGKNAPRDMAGHLGFNIAF